MVTDIFHLFPFRSNSRSSFGDAWAKGHAHSSKQEKNAKNHVAIAQEKLKKFARKKFIHLSAILSKAMNLGLYVNDLLFEHNCVVVPELGGFITRYAPAQINPVSHKITPPGKRIAFNQGLKLNDGILAQHIAVQNQISFEEALKVIHEQVAALKNQLHEIRTVHLDKIGSFYMDEDEIISFHPEPDLNFSTATYGLPTLPAQIISRDNKEELKKKIKTQIDRKPVSPPPVMLVKPQRRPVPISKYLGNSVLMVFIGLLVFFSVSIDTSSNLESMDIGSIFRWSEKTVSAEAPILEKVPSDLIKEINAIPEGQASGYTYDLLVFGIRDTEKAHSLIAGYRKQGLEKARIGLMEHDSTFVSIGRFLDKESAEKALAIAAKHWGTAQLLTLRVR